MKLQRRLFSILVLSVLSIAMIISTPQPVIATKDKSVETNEWTIGIYDEQNNLIPGSENIIFRRDTKFFSGKGKKLFFDFSKGPNYIYVYKGKTDKKTNLATARLENTLKSEPIRQNDAPPERSVIKITKDDKVVIVESPPKIKKIPVRIEYPLYDKMGYSIIISKTLGLEEREIYSQTTSKPSSGRKSYTYVQVPLNIDFYMILGGKVPRIKTKLQENVVGLKINQDSDGGSITLREYTTKDFGSVDSMAKHFDDLESEYNKIDYTLAASIKPRDKTKKYTVKIFNLGKKPKEEISRKEFTKNSAYRDLFNIPPYAAFSIEVHSDGCKKETEFSNERFESTYEILPDCSVVIKNSAH